MNNCSLHYKIINTLRLLSVDMVNNSNSGHPGMPLGWYKYADCTYGIDRFGESAKIADIKEFFDFTLEKIQNFIKQKCN
jgi:transketolase